MSIASDISDLKDLSDGVVANKVSRFAYTEQAYTDNDADGVTVYNVNNDQNIPVGTASVMKVNQTVIEKGWRARASSITRMLMNHFLGRISYNLNKVNDWFNALLASISSYLGQPNGIATLDANGLLAQQEALGSPHFPVTKSFLGAIFGRLLCNSWKQCTGINTSYSVQEIVYANGLWVCIISNNGCWWSEDGKAWTQGIGANTSYTMQYLVYANGIWVCGSSSHGCWWSEDGKAWTQGTGANTSDEIDFLIYGNNIWVCNVYNKGLWWSEDGKAWTQGTGTGQNQKTMCAVYASGIWVVGGYTRPLAWSVDGKAWTQVSGFTSSVLRLVYVNGLWVASTAGYGIYWSTDGKTWTQASGVSDTSEIKELGYANGIWVCMGELVYQGKAWWSIDGKNWVQGTGTPTTYQLSDLKYVNGVWLACGSGVWRSEDGKSWSQSGGGIDNITTNKLAYSKGMFICGCTSHGALYSSIEDLIADDTINFGADIPLVNA